MAAIDPDFNRALLSYDSGKPVAQLINKEQSIPSESDLNVIRTKLKDYTKVWQLELKQARYNPILLTTLKNKVQPLKDKVIQVNTALDCHAFNTGPLKKRTQKLIDTIKEIADAPTAIIACSRLSSFGLPPFPFPLSLSLESQRQAASVQTNLSFDRQIIEINMSLNGATKKIDNEWICFEELTTVDGVIEFAGRCNISQVVNVLDILRANPDQQWKLPYYFGGLTIETLETLFIQATEDWLSIYNQILKNSCESGKTWFENRVMEIRQIFADRNNAIEVEVNRLTATARTFKKSFQVTNEFLENVKALSEKISHVTPASKNFGILLDGYLDQSETFNSLMIDIPKKYEYLERRLSNDEDIYSPYKAPGKTKELLDENRNLLETHKNDSQIVAVATKNIKKFEEDLKNEELQKFIEGCIFGILYRNLFVDEKLSRNSEAYEVFASWDIKNIDDYRKYGLLGNISDEKYKTYTDSLHQSRGLPYVDACRNLAKVEIHYVRDFMRLQIFNREMLQEYLRKHLDSIH